MLEEIISKDVAAKVVLTFGDDKEKSKISSDKFLLFVYEGDMRGTMYLNDIDESEMCDGANAVVEAAVATLDGSSYLSLLAEMIANQLDRMSERLL